MPRGKPAVNWHDPTSWQVRVLVTERGCWEWQGGGTPAGYGITTVNKRTTYMHRLSWEIHRGPIPSGMCVCHRCDNPSCVRPDHLFLGTAKDNCLDRKRKGRNAPGEATRHRGEHHGMAKLSASDVAEIRSAYSALPRNQRVRRGSLSALAHRFSISTTHVRHIVKGMSWSVTP